MKAISIIQPWAWLIAYGGKDIENRSRRTSYRGPIAIHASRRRSWGDFVLAEDLVQRQRIEIKLPMPHLGYRGSSTWISDWPNELALGAVIATAELVDCVVASPSPWFCGGYGLVLRNMKPLTNAVPAKGALGLWEWKETPEVSRG